MWAIFIIIILEKSRKIQNEDCNQDAMSLEDGLMKCKRHI